MSAATCVILVYLHRTDLRSIWTISESRMTNKQSAPMRYRGGLLFRNKPVRLCRKNVGFSMCFRALLSLPYHASGPTSSTEKDIGAENPETTTVSGFFHADF